MSGDKYFITDQHNPYFLTLTVVHWIDLFSRKDYRDVIVESLNYCIKEKNIRVYSWVIMTNHVHLICQASPPGSMSSFLRDFKKFTSKAIIKKMEEIHESRKEWLLDMFAFEAHRTGRAKYFKIWKDDNHAIDLTVIDMDEKIEYIHLNPVRAGWVLCEDHYLYSSAIDYYGGEGLVDVQLV